VPVRSRSDSASGLPRGRSHRRLSALLSMTKSLSRRSMAHTNQQMLVAALCTWALLTPVFAQSPRRYPAFIIQGIWSIVRLTRRSSQTPWGVRRTYPGKTRNHGYDVAPPSFLNFYPQSPATGANRADVWSSSVINKPRGLEHVDALRLKAANFSGIYRSDANGRGRMCA
jgi:hypothetical protein